MSEAGGATRDHLVWADRQGLPLEGGDLGELIRGFDWGRRPSASPRNWPQNLRMALRIMLASPAARCGSAGGRNSSISIMTPINR